MRVTVTSERLDPWLELARFEAEAFTNDGQSGAAAVFVGTTRNNNEHATVHEMALEHYAGMTERQLRKIAEEARRQWSLREVLIVHRVGILSPGDRIVVVATWSSHRAAAINACHYLIEQLKQRAPFWKKESTEGGKRWVKSNSPGPYIVEVEPIAQ